MKANELTFPSDAPVVSFLVQPKSRSHYKHLVRLGRCFPTTASQAKYFIKMQRDFDVLTANDVKKIEALLNKHGFEGEYFHTIGRRWARFFSYYDLYAALRKEHNLCG